MNADGRPVAGSPRARWALGALGLALLVAWGFVWVNNVRRDRMVYGHSTWVPPLAFMAGDFVVSIDHAARVWVAGNDPYSFDATSKGFPYPPLLPKLFAWVAWMSPGSAKVVWMLALAAFLIVGGAASWRSRGQLGLRRVPLTMVLAAVLFSTPVLYAMERGQCDVLVLMFVLAGVALLKTEDGRAEILAGVIFALAAWVKYYPGLIGLGLIGLRRWRALGAFAVAGAAIGLADLGQVFKSLANCKVVVDIFVTHRLDSVCQWEHSLSSGWRMLLSGTRLQGLARVPGSAVAVALLMPPLLWVTRRVAACPAPGRSKLAFPYLTWLVGAATFVPPLANDYNLFFLPIAAMAVWDRRDPAIVHMLMALLLLWWQPFWLPIDGKVLLVCKVFGLYAVAISLATRARELALAPAEVATARAPHFRVAAAQAVARAEVVGGP